MKHHNDAIIEALTRARDTLRDINSGYLPISDLAEVNKFLDAALKDLTDERDRANDIMQKLAQR